MLEAFGCHGSRKLADTQASWDFICGPHWRLSRPSALSLAPVPRGEASGCLPCPFSNWTKSFFSVYNSGGGVTYNLFIIPLSSSLGWDLVLACLLACRSQPIPPVLRSADNLLTDR